MPPTSFVGKLGDLRSTQSKSILARADAKIQGIANRADVQANHSSALDMKHKELLQKLNQQQASVGSHNHKRTTTMQDVNETVNASLKTTQMAEKFKRHPSLMHQPPAVMTPKPALTPTQFPQATFSPSSASLSSSSLSSSSSSSILHSASLGAAIIGKKATNKIDLQTYKEESSKVLNSILNKSKDAEQQKLNFQARLADVQKQGTEDVKRVMSSFTEGISKMDGMKSKMEEMIGKMKESLENGTKNSQSVTMVSEILQSAQNVTSDPSQFSTRLQKNPLQAIHDPILFAWYKDVEDQQKRNAAKTMIVREDEWWLNNRKRKRAELEWTDICLQDTSDTSQAYVVGQAFSGDLHKLTLVVAKLRYYAHTATFEIDTKWNQGKIKADVFHTFSTPSQVLLYSESNSAHDVILILATTEFTEHKKSACLIALDSITGEPVSDFFNNGSPSSIWMLNTDSQLYEGSHAIRMSIDKDTNEILLLCAVQKKSPNGPDLQTIVIRLDENRKVVSHFEHSPPLVQIGHLSNTFSKFTFVGKDIAWIPQRRRFVVCGTVSYPGSQINESHGFITMFDENGKPVGQPVGQPMGQPILSSRHQDDTDTASVLSHASDSASSSHSFEQKHNESSLPSSSPSTPRTPSNGFFVTMDQSKDQSVSKDKNKNQDQESDTTPPTSLDNKDTVHDDVSTNPMTIAGMSIALPVSNNNNNNNNNNIVEKFFNDQKLAQAIPPTTKQFHALNTIRPNYLRPLVPKPRNSLVDHGNPFALTNKGGLQVLGSGYVGHGTHVIEFANVPNLVLQRVKIQNDVILFLGTALPNPNSVKQAFPFVGCLDLDNEKPYNITVLPSSTHQQTSVVAHDFALTSTSPHLYIVGQAFRDPTDVDTSDIALIRMQTQNNSVHIHECMTFPLRGDFHQRLSAIQFSPKLDSMVAVGSSQTRILKAERKGVITLTIVGKLNQEDKGKEKEKEKEKDIHTVKQKDVSANQFSKTEAEHEHKEQKEWK